MTTGFSRRTCCRSRPSRTCAATSPDYLREEIAAEAALRNIPAFAEFLRSRRSATPSCSISTNIGARAGVSAKVVRGYYEILEDTLLGLPPAAVDAGTEPADDSDGEVSTSSTSGGGATLRAASRSSAARSSARASSITSCWSLANYRRYRRPDLEIRFWRRASGYEVDFVLDDMRAAIEVKSGERVHEGDLRGLRALAEEHKVAAEGARCCLEREPRRVGDIESPPLAGLPSSGCTREDIV